MATTPSIVIKRRSEQPAPRKGFNFTKTDLSLPSNSQIITSFRLHAYEELQKMSLPTMRQEAWRRTDLSQFDPKIFTLNKCGLIEKVEIPGNIVDPKREKFSGEIIITSSGVYSWLSQAMINAGVIFCDLKSAERNHQYLVERILTKVNHPDEDVFSTAAWAFAQTGAFLYVPDGLIIDKPFHTVILDPPVNSSQITNILGIVDKNSSASWIYETISLNRKRNDSLFVGNIKIQVESNAHFSFNNLQNWSDSVWNFTHENIQAERDAQVDWVVGAMGSRLTKTFITLDLLGQGSQGKIHGFTFSDNHQHLDYDTQQNHVAPHTKSDLIFKGGVKGNSHTIWQGMIYVAPGAEKADGYQMNRNIVLSPEARIDSLPGLEILADDVRCSHGSTTGNVEYDQIFYLLSRGIPLEEVKKMIIRGFFDPILQQIKFSPVRTRYQHYLGKKL